ncbi:MAG: magnesium/cobalt transporter CorA [Flavobacteriales bacterium]|nr:magnesium/cobalt transporter CorA [Flavobacteriales bacterium]
MNREAINEDQHDLKKVGLPPGSLIYTGKKGKGEVTIELISYNEKIYERKFLDSHDNIEQHLIPDAVNFISINGIHEVQKVEEIGEQLGIHRLILEDILEVNQRPKVEVFDDYIFFTMKMLGLGKAKKKINYEQVSAIMGKNFVLLFQEQQGDIFDGIRERIEKNVGIIRRKGNDFLVYRLLDTVVDNYFIIGDHLGRKLDRMEAEIISDPHDTHVSQLIDVKKQIMRLRRSIIPLKDAVSSLEKTQHPFIQKKNVPYFRDVLEHNTEVIEVLEVYRETVMSLIDLHTSLVSNQMNNIMKVLTIISSIFIPLSFIVGLYGMNFHYMPELTFKYGYFVVLGVILLIILGMLRYFRLKKWL